MVKFDISDFPFDGAPNFRLGRSTAQNWSDNPADVFPCGIVLVALSIIE
ncbi:TPA: hypothetical protein ACPOYY_001545 [Haemophilus influenzae]